jgi:hypothetical protein
VLLGVADRLCSVAFARHDLELGREPFFHGLDQRPGVDLSNLTPLVGASTTQTGDLTRFFGPALS